MLSYFVLVDQTLLFVITADNFQVIELDAPREKLTNLVQGFRDVIEARQLEAIQLRAQNLYQTLVAPVALVLDTPRLVIVPHGPLHYLPFAALQNPETGQYLLEGYELTILPSASALPFIEQNTGKALTSPLVLGNPTITNNTLPPLVAAEKEAQTIASLYGTQPLLAKRATESAVRGQAHQAGILHLAAHGEYNLANPLYSTIYLAPDEGVDVSIEAGSIDPAQDGRLEVYEVYGLDLSNMELVVLSACQTQLGKLSAGDEVVGLTRAFMFAGTPTVVATLWNVNDEATQLLMERFYIHLKEGLGKAGALRQAQLDLIQEDTYANPYYWSAFVLSGDGGEVGNISLPQPTQVETDAEVSQPDNSSTIGMVEAIDDISPGRVGLENVESTTGSDQVETDSDGETSQPFWAALGFIGGGILVLIAAVVIVVGGLWWWRQK